jgi:hypothetical protein
LSANITDSDTALVGVLGNKIGVGDILEIGSEQLMVTAYVSGTKTATVIRGWFGSTAAAHSQNDPIYIRPRFRRDKIQDLINNCLYDLFPDLYQVATVEKTYSGSAIGYDLASDVHRVLRVDGEVDSNALEWVTISDWQYFPQANTSSFTSGKAIMLRRALPAGAVFRVTYSKAFDPVTAESDDLEADSGLAAYMTDLPYYFAMNRVMVDEEKRRSQILQAQNHQRSQDVPPFLALRTGEWYQARYQELRMNAKKRLIGDAPKSLIGGYGS